MHVPGAERPDRSFMRDLSEDERVKHWPKICMAKRSVCLSAVLKFLYNTNFD